MTLKFFFEFNKFWMYSRVYSQNLILQDLMPCHEMIHQFTGLPELSWAKGTLLLVALVHLDQVSLKVNHCNVGQSPASV